MIITNSEIAFLVGEITEGLNVSIGNNESGTVTLEMCVFNKNGAKCTDGVALRSDFDGADSQSVNIYYFKPDFADAEHKTQQSARVKIQHTFEHGIHMSCDVCVDEWDYLKYATAMQAHNEGCRPF